MGEASERQNRAKAERRKIERCGCCRRPMRPYDLGVCENCRAAGRASELDVIGQINGEKLEKVARHREGAGMNPLCGMSIEEIQALAWNYRHEGYGSYGKLRGYVDATGRLPKRGKC